MALTLTIDGADEATLRELFEVGQYASLDDALSAAIRASTRITEAWRKLDAHLDEGLADAAAGRTYSTAEVKAHLDAIIEAKLREAA